MGATLAELPLAIWRVLEKGNYLVMTDGRLRTSPAATRDSAGCTTLSESAVTTTPTACWHGSR